MTQDIPDDPDDDSEAAPAVPLEDADLTIDVVKVDAFLDALKQATPPEENRVVPLIRKPGPRTR
ncbi:hypothetical protein ACSSV6_003485 [Roseovarius sp. MBR-38]|jgi:hypothetical protein|uniref:hypothetical protein n=1 Tax=Roseovarius sp. MBR-78 TaxID=3156460 RepID=UPI00339ABDA1